MEKELGSFETQGLNSNFHIGKIEYKSTIRAGKDVLYL